MFPRSLKADRFHAPPNALASSGKLRSVGVELEFSGMALADAASLVQRIFGGERHVVDTFTQLVSTPEGRFRVEIDSSFLKDRRYERLLSAFGVTLDAHDRKWLEDVLLGVWSMVSPIEVISPPLPMDRLDQLEQLRQRLHDNAALGTRAGLFYAFGMHINIEVPSESPAVIRDYLRAFVLLYPWLKQRTDVDFLRALAPWIKPFPAAYARLILDPDYPADLTRLVNDYMQHNPTRNRPLDMLPLLAWLDGRRVIGRAREKHLIKPRPAFHYRLPNCDIDDPRWTLAREWNIWVAVERLASDPARLARLSRRYLAADRRTTTVQSPAM